MAGDHRVDLEHAEVITELIDYSNTLESSWKWKMLTGRGASGPPCLAYCLQIVAESE